MLLAKVATAESGTGIFQAAGYIETAETAPSSVFLWQNSQSTLKIKLNSFCIISESLAILKLLAELKHSVSYKLHILPHLGIYSSLI